MSTPILYNTLTEETLWNLFRKDDKDAYVYMYEKFAAELYSYGIHLCGDDALVQDCIHDLFVRIYNRRATLGATNSIKYYLFRSLRREIARQSMKQTKTVRKEEAALMKYDFEINLSAESIMIKNEEHAAMAKRLQQSVNSLPKKQREVIYLIYYCEMSYEQVANILDIAVRTVYNQVYNSIQKLKKELEEPAAA
jgi:RNA polymerase sigma factor (sigma-70 family)